MQTITVYSPAELKRDFPDAFDYAFGHWQQDQIEMGCNWSDEIVDSLRAIFEKSGITLRDWSIDGSGGSRSFVKFSMDDTVSDLQGPRAMAWLENNLLGQFRIPFVGEERKRLAKYGSYYRPGMIKPCPLTGVCFDEDYIESLQKDIKAGCTIGEAYRGLADVAAKAFQNEWESQTSEEWFLESGEDLKYTDEGRLV